ncbi:testis-expressed protein 10 homolog isoform X2 [Ornithodoros turicata]|uniref:testis-expressed protein 10 homolog isoform X2 n=1 Tax=Ornithodoros turicata TaxID=34597 RepID=UPI003138DA5A
MGKKVKDFQKQKLRVGKRLPKGLNVTDTSFKSKRIIVPQKTPKASSGGPLTTWKHSIQDIISKLHNYSGTTRLSALEELKEFGSSHPEALTPHLKPLLETLGPICSDRTEAVRQSAHKVLKLVLNSVTQDRLSPFGPLLLSQLGCAVNHISDDVRTDALNLLGIMLECVPSIVISTPYSVLHNFLHMISTCRETAPHSSQRRRVLATHLKKKFTNVEWWARVLAKLEQFLKVALKAWYTDKENSVESKECTRVRITGSSGGVALYKTGLTPTSASGFSLYMSLLASPHGCRESAREFSMELVHLLLDMWTEANPTSSAGEALERGAVALMYSILKVLLLVINWLKRENSANVQWFEDTFGKSLASHFASRFPFSLDCIGAARAVKRSPFEREISPTTLNLSVCEVLATQLRVVPSSQCSVMLQYFRSLLGHEGHVRPGDVKTVLKVSQLLLPHVSAKDRLSLVESVWNIYNCNETLYKADTYLILEFFYQLLLDSRRAVEPLSPVLSDFLRSLPEQALAMMIEEEPDWRVLPFLCKVAVLQVFQFAESFKKCSLHYVDLLESLTEDSHQRTIIGLLCRTADLDEEHMRRLFGVIPNLSDENTLYLLQLLLARCADCKEDPAYLASYYSFLLSVTTGMSSMNAMALERAWSDESSWPTLKELLPELSTAQIVPQDFASVANHVPVVEVALVSLGMFPAQGDLEWIVAPFLDQFFKTYRVVSCTAVVSLLKIVCHKVPSLHTKFGSLFLSMAASILCVAVHVGNSEEEKRSREVVLAALKEYLQLCSCTPAILNMLVQAMQPGSMHILLQQGLLDVHEKAVALDSLSTIKGQEDVQYQRWYCNIVYDFVRQVPKSADS